jgi:hypothetical protein
MPLVVGNLIILPPPTEPCHCGDGTSQGQIFTWLGPSRGRHGLQQVQLKGNGSMSNADMTVSILKGNAMMSNASLYDASQGFPTTFPTISMCVFISYPYTCYIALQNNPKTPASRQDSKTNPSGPRVHMNSGSGSLAPGLEWLRKTSRRPFDSWARHSLYRIKMNFYHGMEVLAPSDR